MWAAWAVLWSSNRSFFSLTVWREVVVFERLRESSSEPRGTGFPLMRNRTNAESDAGSVSHSSGIELQMPGASPVRHCPWDIVCFRLHIVFEIVSVMVGWKTLGWKNNRVRNIKWKYIKLSFFLSLPLTFLALISNNANLYKIIIHFKCHTYHTFFLRFD